MIVPLRSDLAGCSLPAVWAYLLHDAESVVLIDTGLVGGFAAVRRWFARVRRPPTDLKAILLTHGHLDHVAGVHDLRRWSGARVHLHPAERAIAAGRYPYVGPARVCGAMEKVGRMLFARRLPTVDAYLVPGATLPFWGGLEVVPLPGHTPGHVGFLSRPKRLLFCGDLVSHFGKLGFPPRFLNVDSLEVRRSAMRAAALDVDWVWPGHHFGLRHNLIENLRQYRGRRAELMAGQPAGDG